MTQTNIYTVGGTVQAGNGVYIPRKADRQLLALCQERTFSYVLSPRQLGKSSLMVQTAETLRQSGVRTAIIDLQPIGVQLSAEEWYLGLLTELEDQFDLDVDLLDWWDDHEHLGLSQRMTRFFSEVILTEIEEPIVIFVDEIDTTLSLDFTDDFFIAIRYFYTARAQNPAFNRLSFVLIGVATPADLIRNPQRTPFNVGERVDVTDFTLEEAMPLAAGFGISDHRAERLLERILDWTGGHPYLTQRLCQAVTESKQAGTELSEADIDRVVATTFFGSMSDRDNNLQFVRDMLTQRAPDLYSTLTIYKDIWREKVLIEDEEQSLIKSHLKLSGVVKRDADKTLHVRNAIYQQVFNEAWIRDNLPINWRKRVRQLQGAVAAGLLLMTAMSGLTYWAFSERQRAEAALARVGEERDRAEAEAAKARKSSAEAFLQRQEAEAQREEAEEQREEANKQQILAEERRKEAEEGRKAEEAAKGQALLAEQQAEEGQRIAEEATGQALLAKQAEAEQRKIAELQEEEAKSNLFTMTRLIDDIFGLVQGDQNIGIVGFSQFQRSLFDSLLVYHDYIVSNSGQLTNPWQNTQARYRIGRSSEIVGDSVRAQHEYRVAFEEAKSVAREIASTRELPQELLQLLNETAVFYAWNQMNYGNNDAAEAILDEVNFFIEGYRGEESPGLLRSFAIVENAYGQLLTQKGNTEGAFEKQLSAVDFAQRAVSLDEENIELRRTLSTYLGNLSLVDENLLSQEERDKYEIAGCKVARETDKLPHSGAALVNVVANCVFNESWEGTLSEVISNLLNIRRRLDLVIQLEPSNVEFKLSRARINTRLMYMEKIHLSNLEAANNYFNLALSDWLDVIGNGDTFPTELWKLRSVYISLKDHISNFDSEEEKQKSFEKIVAAIDRTNQAFGDAPEVALIAANSMSLLAELQTESNPDASLRNINKAIHSFSKTGITDDTSVYTERYEWVCNAYRARMKINYTQEKVDEALIDLRNIQDICIPIAEKYSFDFYLLSDIWGAHFMSGELLFNAGRFEEAKPVLEYSSYWGGKESTKRLARMYREGLGVQVNIPKAEELEALAEKQFMKRFTIPIDEISTSLTGIDLSVEGVNDSKSPFYVYVYQKPEDYPYRGIDGQIKWLKENRGRTIPEDIAESFRKLHQIAEDNDVSFPELAVYALQRASQQSEQNNQNSEE